MKNLMRLLVMLVAFSTSIVLFSACDGEDEPQVVLVEKVVVTPSSLEKTVDDPSVVLVATITPKNATNKEVVWSSADKKIAYVDAKGRVRFFSPGKTTITATSKDGSKSGTCEVVVKGKLIPVEAVKLEKKSIVTKIGKTEQLEARILPKKASNKELTWESSDVKVATVDDKGLVTAIAAGKTIITVTTKDGNKTDKCEVVVQEKDIQVTAVELNKETVEKKAGETEQLEAKILPENATNKKVTWESSDVKVATVDENGLVKAVAAGEVTITVTTEDGAKTAVCKVVVSNRVYTLPDLDVINHWYDDIVAFEDSREISQRVNPDQAFNPEYTLKNDDLFEKISYWTWYGAFRSVYMTLKEGTTEESQLQFEKFLEENGFVKDTSVEWKQWKNSEKHIVADFYADEKQYRFFARLFDLPSSDKLGAITPEELKAWEADNGGSTTSTDSPYWFNVDTKKSKESVIYRQYFFNEENSEITEVDLFYRNFELFVSYSSDGAFPLKAYFVNLASEKGFERTPDKDELMDGESGKEKDKYYFYNNETKRNMVVIYYHDYQNCLVAYW